MKRIILSFLTIVLLISCEKEIVNEPIVKTLEISEVQFDYAIVSGEISSFGDFEIKDHGFVLAKHVSPTINDEIIALGVADTVKEFDAKFLILEPQTEYYVCSYVQYGDRIKYGNVLSFQTSVKPWIKKNNFNGGAIIYPASFVIDNGLYCGLGWNSGVKDSCIYKYSLENDLWSEIATIPTEWRCNPISFSINGYGYIGLGYNLDGMSHNYFNDLWKYNPEINSWEKMADFPCDGARFGSCFVIGNKAYVVFEDELMWEYNTLTNEWTSLGAYPGKAGGRAIAFSINNKGYVGLGWNSGDICNDLWEYDPANDLWTEKVSHPVPGYDGIALSYNEKGYVFCGKTGDGYSKKIWTYDPVSDSWSEVEAYYPGQGSYGMLIQNVNSKIIIGLGGYGSSSIYWGNDIWEFNPDF